MNSPGVVHLQCPRTGVFNFSPHFKKIAQPDEFDFRTLPPYRTASKDPTLLDITKAHNAMYCGSTSSMTSSLSQFCFLLTHHKPVDTRQLSAIFDSQMKSMTKLTRAPTSIIVSWKDGCYAIDAEKPADDDEEALSEENTKNNQILAALVSRNMVRAFFLSC
jgi:hypothetical protein